MNRRNFIASLLAAPILRFVNINSIVKVSLPIGCDMSMRSLEWAVRHGSEHKFGDPHKLVVGPENLYVARYMLGEPRQPYTADSEVNALYECMLTYEVAYSLPYNYWMVQFDRGTVYSQGA